ncbi:hypothetical protein [Vallicoccus soli]|uniref:phosphatase domain-containing protein n=1 Tax=Vallicoccus soli TaxID=2339232 RepID=UPI001C498262|nr:hypothetical protein [Vallicoccus soli]
MDALPYAAVDLDGTVADVRHRLHLVAGRPRRWDAFFAAARDDAVLPEGEAVVRRLVQDHDLVWLSGRPERCRRDTAAWLREHGLPPGELVLRPEGDRRPAAVVKIGLLRRLARERPLDVLVDDDPAVVRAARRAGFTVLHATWMGEAREEREVLHGVQERDGGA